MSIKFADSPKAEEEIKPREKIALYGIESLNDAELLSVILGTGYKDKGVEELSEYLLSEFGVKGLFQFRTIDEIKSKTGLPFVKSCVLLAIGEYIIRLGRKDGAKIKSSQQFYDYIKDDFNKIFFEQLRIVCLDSQRRALFSGLVAQGESNVLSVTLSSVLYHPIRLNSKNFYLAHNHPRGVARPSEEDISFTLKLKEESKKFGLSFDDHIIIGDGGFYSFSLKGIL